MLRYMHLPFGVVPLHSIFRKKIDKFFSDMLNVYGIADDILIAAFDEWGIDHDVTLNKKKQAGKFKS